MIDLTPLDVRKKAGDFGKALRGYDPQEVNGFLELVAERMEALVKENLAFQTEVGELNEKVVLQQGREQAVQAALVTAQELRQDVKEQATREAKLLEREARGRVEGMIAESERRVGAHRTALEELERQRDRFLKAFRTMLERELDTVEVELGRAPLEDVTLGLKLGKTTGLPDAEADDMAGNEHEHAVDDRKDHSEAHAKQIAGEGREQPRAPDSGVSEVENGVTEGQVRQIPEGQGGDGSLWLSSILKDRKDEDGE